MYTRSWETGHTSKFNSTADPWDALLVIGLQLDFVPLITTHGLAIQPVFSPPRCLLIHSLSVRILQTLLKSRQPKPTALPSSTRTVFSS